MTGGDQDLLTEADLSSSTDNEREQYAHLMSQAPGNFRDILVANF